MHSDNAPPSMNNLTHSPYHYRQKKLSQNRKCGKMFSRADRDRERLSLIDDSHTVIHNSVVDSPPKIKCFTTRNQMTRYFDFEPYSWGNLNQTWKFNFNIVVGGDSNA